MPSAMYATNVYHYDHVLSAMNEEFDELGLLRQFETSQDLLEKLRSAGVPQWAVELLSRRSRQQSSIPKSVKDLGPAQFLLPVLTRAGIKISPLHTRLVTSSYARKVAKESRNYDILQFVEGLGYQALQKNTFSLSICERRNFHHSVFEEELEPLDGFPSNGKPDALAHILDYEYSASDYILVYSNAARESFTSRGFSTRKVLVAPIAVSDQLPRVIAKRDPYRIIYVGRGDIHKGIDVAVAAVRAMGNPYRLTVAGAMSPSVRTWLAKKEHVDYVGILSKAQLRDLYSTSTAMVLPSTESFGLAAAEAVHHGLALVCSDMTGVAEYLQPGSRTIVVGRDPIVWAHALVRVARAVEDSAKSDYPLSQLQADTVSKKLQQLYAALAAGSK